jgi:hypothetical protein
MQDEQVGHTAQAKQRVVVVDDDRLLRQVARRHHERNAGGAQQEIVERRVGHHHADERIARRHQARQRRVGAPGRQDDRALRRHEQRLLRRVEIRQGGGVLHRPDHDGEWLLVTLLAVAQPSDGRVQRRVARKLESPDALQRDDEPLAETARGLLYLRSCGASAGHVDGVGRGEGTAVGGAQIELRSAHGTGVGFGVEPPRVDGAILTLARGAHREGRHRRRGAVVRRRPHDREARPAVRAVRERIPEPAVGRIVDLRQTRRAGREVGRNRHALIADRFARDDREAVGLLERDGLFDHAVDDRSRRTRGVPVQPLDECVERPGGPEGFDGDARAVITHAAGDGRIARDAIHPWSEAHTLHGALHPDAASGRCPARRRPAAVEGNAHGTGRNGKRSATIGGRNRAVFRDCLPDFRLGGD